MTIKFILGAGALALTVSACARHVTIDYTPTKLVLTPIRSTVDLRVEDGRRQGGQSISRLPQDILVARPVTQIVGDAVAAELAGQGIQRGPGGPTVEVEVWAFDFDYRVLMFNNEFSGEVAFRAAVQDTGRTIIDRIYKGSASERGWLTNAMIGRLMAGALAEAVRDLGEDAEFMRVARGTKGVVLGTDNEGL